MQGKIAAVILENSMAPQVQPGICLAEFMALFHQPFGDISGHANKPILGRGVNIIAFTARLAGAFDNPVGDLVGQHLGIRLQCIGDIAQHLELVHNFQRIPAFLYPGCS